ncbi:PACE efflux transporter [Ursidibacter arcticus]
MSKTMTIKERLIHTVLFEFGAVVFGVVFVLVFSQVKPSMATLAVVGLVSIAMVWNLLFNIGFDKVFTAPRETRSFGVRVLHTLLFKLGLMLATVPVMMALFHLTLWQAIMADMALTVAIMVYALLFNWIYDKARLKFV